MSSVTTVQMMLISISTVVIMPSFCLDNGLALTPPMGWSSWNAFHRNFNESTFMQTADVMAKNGMLDAGYEYINVDGGWWGGSDTGTITRNCLHLIIKCQKWSWLASSITLAECIIDSLPVPSEPTLTLTPNPKKKFPKECDGLHRLESREISQRPPKYHQIHQVQGLQIWTLHRRRDERLQRRPANVSRLDHLLKIT